MRDRLNELMGNIWSIFVAITRLFFLITSLIPAALQVIFYNRIEIVNVEMQGLPWRCDRDKMNEQISFVDKLYRDNPDLVDPNDIIELPPEDDDNNNGKK